VLWTPAAGKAIHLTAIGSSATASLSVDLERASNVVWLVIAANPYTPDFSSPIVFNTNESILLTATISLLTFNITLFGYEQ